MWPFIVTPTQTEEDYADLRRLMSDVYKINADTKRGKSSEGHTFVVGERVYVDDIGWAVVESTCDIFADVRILKSGAGMIVHPCDEVRIL